MPRTAEKTPTKTIEKRKTQTKKAAPIEVTVDVAAIVEGPVCAHHWVIASPNGETSTGKCKVCGTEKEFPNSADDYLWERSVPQSRWTGRADSSPSSFTAGY